MDLRDCVLPMVLPLLVLGGLLLDSCLIPLFFYAWNARILGPGLQLQWMRRPKEPVSVI